MAKAQAITPHRDATIGFRYRDISTSGRDQGDQAVWLCDIRPCRMAGEAYTKEAFKRHREQEAREQMLGNSDGVYAWIVDPKLSIAFTASQRLAAETLLLSPRPTKSQVWGSQCQNNDNMTQARHIIVGDLYAQSRLVYYNPPSHCAKDAAECKTLNPSTPV